MGKFKIGDVVTVNFDNLYAVFFGKGSVGIIIQTGVSKERISHTVAKGRQWGISFLSSELAKRFKHEEWCDLLWISGKNKGKASIMPRDAKILKRL